MGKADKRKKFEELANSRVNKILNLIRLLGNLSRKSNYSYSSQDVNKIKKVIEQELKRTWGLFAKGADIPEGEEFKI